MTLPDITVITPVWNGAEYLERCVRSVFAQTHANWEHIVVDDGSSDDSFAIAERLAKSDPRLRVVRQKNRGAGAARNVAVALARGAQIAYLDSDDEYYPDFLANAVRVRGRGDVLVFCYDLANDDPARGKLGVRKSLDPSKTLGSIMDRNPFTPLAVAHERHLFERTGTFNEELFFEEDWDLWKRFHLAGAKFTPLARKSGLYRVRGNSQARTKRAPDILPAASLRAKTSTK